MAKKHVPLRKCVACGSSLPKKELLRIALTQGGALVFDSSGKFPGRGFYLCPRNQCLELAIKNKNWAKKFNLSFSQDLISELREAIKKQEGEFAED